MKIKKYKCSKCSYDWWSRVLKPKKCPKCQAWINYRLDCRHPLYHKIHKIREKASGIVQHEIIRGRLKKLDGKVPCADCGGVATEYDHRDYRKPLVVEPVCRTCNKRRGPSIDILNLKGRYKS